MTERMSLADFKALGSAGALKKPNKYNARRTLIDGIWFDSKLEARRYEELKALRKAGAVAWFVRQPGFDLPGGIRYRADFLVVWMQANRTSVDRVGVEDCKGMSTRLSMNKIAMVEELYGIKVEILRAKR